MITGEGSFDHQSLRGKVVAGVAGAARDRGVPCVVLAGQVSTGRREAAAAGVTEAYSLVEHFGGEEGGGVAAAMGRPGRGAAGARRPAGPAVEPLRGPLACGRGSPAPDRSPAEVTPRRGGVRSDLDHTGNHWPTRLRWPVRIRTHTAQGDFHVTTPAQTESTEAKAPTSVVLTDVAAQKVKALIEQEGRDDLRLRVAVQPGGCSGLRYQLFFDERSLDGDVVTDFDGVEVVVDRMSAPYLAGATIDFADRIDAQGFTIDNPNARNSCACGDSFTESTSRRAGRPAPGRRGAVTKTAGSLSSGWSRRRFAPAGCPGGDVRVCVGRPVLDRPATGALTGPVG